MKKIKDPLFLALLGVVIILSPLMFCDPNHGTKQAQVTETNEIQIKSEEDSLAEVRQREKEMEFMDTTAIGNIHLNTLPEVFEQEKQQFLAETNTLGNLRIKSVDGFFYDGRLAAVEIISYPHQSDQEFGFLGKDAWGTMYYQKYNDKYSSGRRQFDYIKGRKGIEVNDYCASSRPFSSFRELMEKPLEKGYRDEPLFPPKRIESDVDGFIEVQRVLDVLPKSKAQLYINELNNTLQSAVVYQRIYDELRGEANQIIQRRNEINSRKHKNDPIYSVIIIWYLPAYDKMSEELIMERNQNEQEKELELDKI